MSRFVKLQVSRSPGDPIALTGVILALLGLLGSLFIRPRRIWVRVRRDDGADPADDSAADPARARRTLVEVAGLDRSAGGDLSGEIDEILAALTTADQEDV
jgi:cytochrome c biogenesis protein